MFLKRPVVAKGGDASVPGFTTRFLTDARMLEAHEQLVLGPATVWIGDCMRRDPSKRDAFETYCDLNVPTARSARRSFERMWSMASTTGPGQGVRRLTDLPGCVPGSLSAFQRGSRAARRLAPLTSGIKPTHQIFDRPVPCGTGLFTLPTVVSRRKRNLPVNSLLPPSSGH